MPVTINDYRNLHLWLLIPFAISIFGFSFSYYLRFSEATFHQHVHGLSATFWYILIVAQPYLITRRKNIQLHKRLGIIGVLLAGLVAGSAWTIIPNNINNVAELSDTGFFSPNFAYTATLFDFLAVLFFLISVSLAVLNYRDLHRHSTWMIASIFFVLTPGLMRLVALVLILSAGGAEGVSLARVALPSFFILMPIVLLFYYKLKALKHVSLYLIVLLHLPMFFIDQIGSNTLWRSLADAIFSTR